MESRRRNQLKSKGTANLKQKLKDNAERLKKENRFHQYNRNMSPGTPEAVDVPQPKLRTQPKLKISQIENRTEKLETWRLEKNRIKLQEIQDHRSPFQSGKFFEPKLVFSSLTLFHL